MDQQKIVIERQTYNLLEWIGDVGGLFDGLSLLANLFVAPVASLLMNSELKRSAIFSQPYE